jgi:hypothetical protein
MPDLKKLAVPFLSQYTDAWMGRGEGEVEGEGEGGGAGEGEESY